MRKPSKSERQAHLDFITRHRVITTAIDNFLAGIDYARTHEGRYAEATATDDSRTPSPQPSGAG